LFDFATKCYKFKSKIVMSGTQTRKRRMGIPRLGGNFVAPSNNTNSSKAQDKKFKLVELNSSRVIFQKLDNSVARCSNTLLIVSRLNLPLEILIEDRNLTIE
jgi:hypothetical protein